ncbi:unnamed protein product [Meloidogyne enterolobii]|uniref:Uncharacterized protein n=1 Tax=Meloidogyne enterolobii TaxID=390850 RepID=A0ACB1AB73_MELEN
MLKSKFVTFPELESIDDTGFESIFIVFSRFGLLSFLLFVLHFSLTSFFISNFFFKSSFFISISICFFTSSTFLIIFLSILSFNFISFFLS